MNRAMVYLHAVSPLHVGTGQAFGTIDLPIQRERGTHLPIVPGSGLKGVIKAECEPKAQFKDVSKAAFGTENNAGAVTFGDARLLLMPVRSVRLLFAWVTCPYVLRRYLRDVQSTGIDDATAVKDALAATTSLRGGLACSEAALTVDATGSARSVFLEDWDFAATVAPAVTTLATSLAARCLPDGQQELLASRLVVVDDSTFGTIIRQCTEITAHIKMGQSGTAEGGGLWYEEALPTETVLYSQVLIEECRGANAITAADSLKMLEEITSAQFGGKASVGRGLCGVRWKAGHHA